jgi:uncharacterized membrane protein YgcG
MARTVKWEDLLRPTQINFNGGPEQWIKAVEAFITKTSVNGGMTSDGKLLNAILSIIRPYSWKELSSTEQSKLLAIIRQLSSKNVTELTLMDRSAFEKQYGLKTISSQMMAKVTPPVKTTTTSKPTKVLTEPSKPTKVLTKPSKRTKESTTPTKTNIIKTVRKDKEGIRERQSDKFTTYEQKKYKEQLDKEEEEKKIKSPTKKTLTFNSQKAPLKSGSLAFMTLRENARSLFGATWQTYTGFKKYLNLVKEMKGIASYNVDKQDLKDEIAKYKRGVEFIERVLEKIPILKTKWVEANDKDKNFIMWLRALVIKSQESDDPAIFIDAFYEDLEADIREYNARLEFEKGEQEQDQDILPDDGGAGGGGDGGGGGGGDGGGGDGGGGDGDGNNEPLYNALDDPCFRMLNATLYKGTFLSFYFFSAVSSAPVFNLLRGWNKKRGFYL